MKLERFKTDKKDVLRSAGYALAIGATLFEGYQLVRVAETIDASSDNFSMFESAPIGNQTPIPATDDEKKMYRMMVDNPYSAPPLVSLTSDQQYFLHEAEEDRISSEKHFQKVIATLPIILPALWGAMRGKRADNEGFFAFRRTA